MLRPMRSRTFARNIHLSRTQREEKEGGRKEHGWREIKETTALGWAGHIRLILVGVVQRL